MSFGRFEDAKERIRQSVDIADLVGSYLDLRRQGRHYVAHCPWHDDTRPSLQINPVRQTWKCWVCNIGGDIFSFVMQREGISFREALTMLAERAGVELPSSREPHVEPGSPQDKRSLYAALAWAESQFQECLLRAPVAEAARQYLLERRISPDSVARFHLGYAPDSWQWLLDRARGTPHSPAVLEAAGLLAKSDNSGKLYDRFRGRLIFPIRDLQGRALAFGGRVLPGASASPAKYINSPETLLFSKSDQVYGLDVARDAVSKSRTITVMEGYTDVIMAHQCGVSNVVAVLGTALNERHIRLLRRFADRVVLVLDGDEAGQRRTNEVLELFVAAQLDLRILTLPEEFDPCEYLLERGGPAFQELLATAIDALEHRIRVATADVDVLHDTHRAHQALEKILGTLAKAGGDGADSALRLREQQLLTRLARHFLLQEQDLRQRLQDLRLGGSRGQAPRPAPPAPRVQPLAPRERELLELLTLHPELVEEVSQVVTPAELSHELGRQLFAVMERLWVGGELPAFARVMDELEDPQLKHFLVELEEQASLKELVAGEPAPARLAKIRRDYEWTAVAQQNRAQLAALEARKLDATEETEVLLKLLTNERQRHGLSAPTEG